MISTLSFVFPTVDMTANGNIPVSDFQTKDFYESTAVKTASEKGLTAILQSSLSRLLIRTYSCFLLCSNGNVPVSDFPTKEFYESRAGTTASEKGVIVRHTRTPSTGH